MVEEQSSRFAGRAKILEPGEKVDAGEYTLEDYMQQIEAIPSNKRLLRQIGVRESVMRVRMASIRTAASMCPSPARPKLSDAASPILRDRSA